MTMETSGARPRALAHHFESLEQQHEAAALGMWAFLAQEVMFFGGLFTAYLVYRYLHPSAFAEGSAHLPIRLGTANTGVLIGSSLTMALAVRAAQLGRSRTSGLWIGATLVLAFAFLGVKAVEYADKWHHALIPGVRWAPGPGSDPHLNLFFALYFVMTGMHALHMAVGIGIMLVVGARAVRGRLTGAGSNLVECLGLYWHFVDIVWIFLFPLLYLLHGAGHGAHP